MINIRELDKILDENSDPIEIMEESDEFEQRSPCWEAKVDKTKNKILFLVDGVEKMSTSLKKFKPDEITVGLLVGFIQLLKEGNISELKKVARIK